MSIQSTSCYRVLAATRCYPHLSYNTFSQPSRPRPSSRKNWWGEVKASYYSKKYGKTYHVRSLRSHNGIVSQRCIASNSDAYKTPLLPWQLPRSLVSFLEKTRAVSNVNEAEQYVNERCVMVKCADGDLIYVRPEEANFLVYPLEDEVFVRKVDGGWHNINPEKYCHPRTAELYAYYKPKGMATTMATPEKSKHPERHLAHQVSLLAEGSTRLHPVGRLDQDTSGLLLLSSNGELTDMILRPGLVSKTYVGTTRVPRSRAPTSEQLQLLEKGVMLSDGMARATNVHIIGEEEVVRPMQYQQHASEPEVRYQVALSVREGRHRVVRRMMAAAAMPLKALHRLRIGSIDLNRLGLHAPGQVRGLAEHEVAELWEHLGGDEAYVETKMPHLLCRYRTGLLGGQEDVRLRAFLLQHWTTDGPCFDQRRFPKMDCPSEVRESHRQFC
mmetsp:Transcript_14175/g.30314  ORF Transcript_14175/g.30314 Transcript_14175/m.30314 type:complete len:442 (-) Transcript_14175:86-1411(-)